MKKEYMEWKCADLKATYFTVVSSNNTLPDCASDMVTNFPIVEDIVFYCSGENIAIIGFVLALTVLVL